MAEAKRFRVYIETRVSTVVELDAKDLAVALEAAPGHGPFVSSNDNAWEQSGDWEALAAYDAATDAQLFPHPAAGRSRRAQQDSTLTDQRGGDPILGVYDADEALRESPHAEISAYRSDGDSAFVVQIDTAADLGQIRVFINDGAVYDADPATGESQLNIDTRQQARQ